MLGRPPALLLLETCSFGKVRPLVSLHVTWAGLTLLSGHSAGSSLLRVSGRTFAGAIGKRTLCMGSPRWQEVSPRSSRDCCLQRSFPKVGGEAEREVKRGSFQASLGQPWVCSGPAVYRSVSLSFQLFYCGEPPGLRGEWSHWASEGPPGGIGLDPWERGQGGADEGRRRGRCSGSGELGQGRGPSTRGGCALGTRLCGIG